MSEVKIHSALNTQTIFWSDAAKQHAINYLQREKGSYGVRLSVQKTGCSGLSYVIDYIFEPQDTDLIFPFSGSYQLYVDKASYPVLKGTSIDYVQQGLNFKMASFKANPCRGGMARHFSEKETLIG